VIAKDRHLVRLQGGEARDDRLECREVAVNV
jgi:hypothetical protein